MSYESSIAATVHFLAGEDKVLNYEIFSIGSTTLMEDVATFALRWEMRKTTTGKDPYRAQGASVLSKTSALAGGITVTGVYNSTRAINTQRVIVTIDDIDTEALAGGRYVCALKRTDAGFEAVLSHGVVELLVASAR